MSTEINSTPAAPRRVHKLHKLGDGDYLFLSNDKQTIWRVIRFDRDWDTLPGETTPRQSWTLWKYVGHSDKWEFGDCFAWDWWEPYGQESTRRAVIEYALSN